MSNVEFLVESKKNRCSYCGNNPVNHTLSYVSQSISAFFMKEHQGPKVLQGSRVRYFEEKMLTLLFFIFQSVGLVRYNIDIQKVVSDRSKVVWEEAKRRGMQLEQIVFLGKPTEHFRMQVENTWHQFFSVPIPPQFGHVPTAWMDNKSLLKDFFKRHHVRVPQGGRATSIEEATDIFNAIQKPVIVKPEIGSRGRHTVTHIYTLEELRHAFTVAQTLCHFVVVEEHLVGSVYRATYVGGEVAGILRGDPPRIVGDGTATIQSLITQKNALKHERQKDFVVTASSTVFLKRQGYTLDTILPAGKTIDLTEKIGLSYGGFSSEDFPITHPKLLTQLKQAGDALSVALVGFDFISEDISQDPDTVRWGIIEANMMPFIDLHHTPLAGTPINVAAKVWDLWK